MTEKPSTLDQLESRYTEMIGFTPPKIAKRLKLGMQVDPELVTALEDWRIAALTPKALDVQDLARRLVAHAPERCLWGSNWPHPGRTPRPDNATLLALLAEWAPDPTAIRKILVDNPAFLYGFG